MFTGILIEVVGLVCFSIFDKMSVYYWLNHPLIIPKRGRREKHTRINWRSSKCINPSIPIIPSINSIQSAHDPNYRFPTNRSVAGRIKEAAFFNPTKNFCCCSSCSQAGDDDDDPMNSQLLLTLWPESICVLKGREFSTDARPICLSSVYWPQ